jgi:hypothetical protein
MVRPDTKAAWDRASGLPPGSEQDADYLKEMIRHPASGFGLLGAIAAGAVLSIPLGLGFAAIPLLAFAGAEAIAALFVPSSPVFQARIDRRKRAERREATRAYLMQKIEEKAPHPDARTAWAAEFHNATAAWARMQARLESLRRIAGDSASALSPADLERLEEAALDFLRLLYSRIQVRERMAAGRDQDIERQIASLEEQFKKTENAVDRKKLEKAWADLKRIQAQRARLPARDAAAAAQLTTMSETFEEIFHRITTDPASPVGDYLEVAAQRLSIEEELSLAVDEELDDDRLTRASRASLAQHGARAGRVS